MVKKTKKTKSRYQAMKEKMRQKVRDNAQKKRKKGAANYLTLPSDFDSNEDLFYPKKKGTYKLSILPYEITVDGHPDEIEPGEIWYKRVFLVHKSIGANNKTVICPKNFGKRCPICEEAQRLWDAVETKEDEDEASAVSAKRRMMMNVLIDGEVKLWEVSEHTFGDGLLYPEINEDEEYDGFYFLEKEDGWDLKIRFTEGSYKTFKFIEPTKLDFVERAKDLSEDLFDEVWDLDTLIECPSSKELKELFYEEEDSDDDEEEEEEKPKRRKTKKRKPAPEPEDDDEEEEDDDDEEEPEEEEEEDLEEELNDMKLGALNKFVKDHNLDLPKITKKNKEEMIEEILELMDDEGESDVDEEEEDAELDLDEMDKDELLEFCKENKLKPPVKVKKKEKKLREWIEEQLEDEEEEDEDVDDDECPYGHEFGTDNDEHDECEECDKWDACADAQ